MRERRKSLAQVIVTLCFALGFGCAEGGRPLPPTNLKSRQAEADAATPIARPAERAELAPGERRARASLLGTDVLGLPTGVNLTPDAAPDARILELDPHLAAAPKLRAGGAVATALSPDGRTLAVLTSGYNRTYDAEGKRVPGASDEYVFLYDVSGGEPRESQVLRVPNAFGGIAFHPGGRSLFVSGGPDDVVHELTLGASGGWEEKLEPIALGHLDKKGFGGLGARIGPFAAGLALTPSGERLVVANHENDSVTVIDTRSRSKVGDVVLRNVQRAGTGTGTGTGTGSAGGEFPRDVVVLGDDRAWVTSLRDREIVLVDPRALAVKGRVKVGGAPTRLLANRAATRLYVANANSDTVSIVDPARGAVLAEIPTAAPPGASLPASLLRGSNPNGLALSPDERTLYVTNGGNNTLAIVDLESARVVALVPTGFYPHAVSAAGRYLYVANGKKSAGPNARGPWSDAGRAATDPYFHGAGNEHVLQLQTASLLAFPVPAGEALGRLTVQALLNNRFVGVGGATKTVTGTGAGEPGGAAIWDVLRRDVRHVVYVIGENRSYDQVLGDLERTDHDPRLLHFGERLTPNQHALARTFVALDRFFDAGGVSGDGWQWTMGGRSTDVAEKAIPLEYAERGHHGYDWEGMNRNVNVGLPTLAERLAADPDTPNDPDLLPGTGDVGAIDGPDEGGRGFLWDVAIAAGLEVRNYGAFCDLERYRDTATDAVPLLRSPFEAGVRVAFPTKASLAARTDPFYRTFDLRFADFWREREWARELDLEVERGQMPGLEIVRLPRDHLGSFAASVDRVDTPDTQMADHDYALGLLVQKLSHSPFWAHTLVVALEDDAQNGADHVDAHRSFVFFAGPHVRRGAVVSTVYATPSVLRTIELVLGLPPLGQEDAVAPPMADVFTDAINTTPFEAIVPAVLRTTELPLLPPGAGAGGGTVGSGGAAEKPRGDARTWEAATHGWNFWEPDAVPPEAFNRVLFCGLVGCEGP